MHSGTRFFWYQKLGRSRTMFYSSPETYAHDSNAALLLAAESWIHVIHCTRSSSSANKFALLIYSLIIIALFFVLINSDGLPWLESHFNAGPAAFWPSKWTDEIGDAMFLVPVSRVWCAKLGHKFLVPETWAENLGHVPSALGLWLWF